MRINKTVFLSLFILIALLIFSGCEDEQKPRNLIPQDTYTDLLLEVHITESAIRMENLESKRDSILETVFNRYDVTFDQFETSHAYYQRQADKQLERIDKIRSELRDERQKLLEVRQELRQKDQD